MVAKVLIEYVIKSSHVKKRDAKDGSEQLTRKPEARTWDATAILLCRRDPTLIGSPPALDAVQKRRSILNEGAVKNLRAT